MKKTVRVVAVLSIAAVLAAAFFYNKSLKEDKTETNVTEEAQTSEGKNYTTGSEEAAVKNEKEEASAEEGTDGGLTEAEQAMIDAHISLFSNFEKGPEGVVYPDDFCGEYQKDDRLHIVLRSTDDATIRKYNEYVKYSDAVVYEQARIPLKTLEAYRDDMWKKLEENGIQPYSGYVDQFSGTIKFEVAGENVESATAFLEELIAGGEYGNLSTEEIEVSKGGRASPNTSNIYS